MRSLLITLLLLTIPCFAQQYNVGGGVVTPFVADPCTGGASWSASGTVSISKLATGLVAPPQSVLLSERYGTNVVCVVSGLTPNASYLLTGWWSENYWAKTGQRTFGMLANGVVLLSGFDIVKAAGAPFTAYTQVFPVTADATGKITLSLTMGTADLPKIDAFQIAPVAVPLSGKQYVVTMTANMTLDANGNATFTNVVVTAQ